MALEEVRDSLKHLLESTREGANPVDLEEPIGRLTRMDAIQQQKMTTATRRRSDVRLKLINLALAAMEQDEYGLCRKCDEQIGYIRLKARPESPFCIECQDALERGGI